MPPDDTETVGRAVRAFGLARATGAPWLACVTGAEAVPTDDEAARELRLGALATLGRPSFGLLDTAMLADLTLGAAVRARVGAGRPLPLMSLTVELDLAPLPPETSVRGWSDPVRNGLGRSHGILLCDGSAAGRCLATFAVPVSAADLVPLPWETPSLMPMPDVPAEPLTAAEHAALAAVRTLTEARLAAAEPWTDALLALACSVDPAGPGTTFLRPTAAMLNRSGQVQGAVLFWLAAVPSMAALGLNGVRMVSGHLQFLSPASPHALLSASPVMLHATRRTFFVRTDIRQAGRLVASGDFVYRRVT